MKYYFYSPLGGTLACGDKILARLSKNVTVLNAENDRLFTVYHNGCFPSFVGGDVSENVKLYDFYYGKLVIPVQRKLPLPFDLITEKNTSAYGYEIVARLYRDGQTRLDISVARRLLTVNVPIDAEDLNMINCGNSVLIELEKNVKFIVLVSLVNFSVIFSAVCAGYSIKETLSVDKFIMGTTAFIVTEHYSVTDKVTLIGKSMKRLSSPATASDLITAAAFLETVRYDGDHSAFLAPSLIDKKEVIKDFIGDHDYVIPPVEREYKNNFALIDKKTVRYASFSFENGKISDISVESKPVRME